MNRMMKGSRLTRKNPSGIFAINLKVYHARIVNSKCATYVETEAAVQDLRQGFMSFESTKFSEVKISASRWLILIKLLSSFLQEKLLSR
jgi:hypothetical protein